MSDTVGPKGPPAAYRFRKGQSGNPKGRPKSRPDPAPSAFDIVLDRNLTVVQDGKARELTAEEALQLKTYQAALAGNRAAQRKVLGWIEKRDRWLAARAAKRVHVESLIERVDPDNAEAALLVLGIAERDMQCGIPEGEGVRLLLQPWAVQSALRRRGRPKLSARNIFEITRCTRDADTLRWPAGARDEQHE